MHFDYHKLAKSKIKKQELIDYMFLNNYNGIKNVMLLIFKDNKNMPIRDYDWHEYYELIEKYFNKH